MSKNKYKLGSHVSLAKINFISKKKYLVGSLYEALSYNSNAFMIYTGPPQTTKRVPMEEYNVYDFKQELKKNNFDIKNIIVHAPYIINPANPIKEKRDFCINFLTKEIIRANYIGVKIVVLHPGNYLDSNINQGIKNCANVLNQIFFNTKNLKVKIALETMAGKGTEIGFKFEHLREIMNLIKDEFKYRIGVCIDTCHIYDAGYDIKNYCENVINQIKNNFKKEKIFCIHINDSKFGLNSKKDRHANIDMGGLGINAITNFISDDLLKDKVMILETPWINKMPPYKNEIKKLLSNLNDKK